MTFPRKYRNVKFSSFSNPAWKYVGRSEIGLKKMWTTKEVSFQQTLELWTTLLWYCRKIDHYFLDEGVADFCERSVKKCNDEFRKTLPSCERIDAFGNEISGGFAVHFPSKEKRRSLVIIPNHNNNSDMFFLASNGEISISAHKNMNGEIGDKWEVRFVFGLSLYLDAFPDVVKMAKSGDISHERHYRGQRQIVGRSEYVCEDERNRISPHWRRGHFRMLNAERFKKKQGQTVFVRGTFVKGNPVAVLSDSNTDKEAVIV